MFDNPLSSGKKFRINVKTPKVEFYEDAKLPNHKWRWRLSMSSDEIAASSQGYATEALAKENFIKIAEYIKWLIDNRKV